MLSAEIRIEVYSLNYHIHSAQVSAGGRGSLNVDVMHHDVSIFTMVIPDRAKLSEIAPCASATDPQWNARQPKMEASRGYLGRRRTPGDSLLLAPPERSATSYIT